MKDVLLKGHVKLNNGEVKNFDNVIKSSIDTNGEVITFQYVFIEYPKNVKIECEFDWDEIEEILFVVK